MVGRADADGWTGGPMCAQVFCIWGGKDGLAPANPAKFVQYTGQFSVETPHSYRIFLNLFH